MNLTDLTAHELSGLLGSRQLSVVELTKAYLDRIEKIEPVIGSFITVLYEDSLKQAESIEKEFASSGHMPPLAGIPQAIKDNICTRGIPTTCGSRILKNFIPPYDAFAAKKLYDQKTVLLGKLNMDEFAMGSSCSNCIFKLTRNPWDTERVPGGSSGGSAAAVAAGEAVFTIGTDTGGSVRQPASFCGVVGMKPTYGAVSRNGLVAFASSLDQIGPITKDVTDCALVLNAITGHDEADSTSARVRHPDYLKALVKDVKGVKIGIPKEYFEGIDAEVKTAVLKAAGLLERLGAELKECSLPLTEHAVTVYDIISSAEASSNLARYDGVKYGFRAEEYENPEELYIRTRSEGFGFEVKKRIILGAFVLSWENYDAYYKKALKVRRLIVESFKKAFYQCDVILGPTTPTTAYSISESNNYEHTSHIADKYILAANLSGLPAISIPCGFDAKGLPIGLHLIGKPFCESVLLRTAYTFEQNTSFHKERPKLSEESIRKDNSAGQAGAAYGI